MIIMIIICLYELYDNTIIIYDKYNYIIVSNNNNIIIVIVIIIID